MKKQNKNRTNLFVIGFIVVPTWMIPLCVIVGHYQPQYLKTDSVFRTFLVVLYITSLEITSRIRARRIKLIQKNQWYLLDGSRMVKVVKTYNEHFSRITDGRVSWDVLNDRLKNTQILIKTPKSL
jgi:hypothetical protein